MANPEHLALVREGSAAANRFASENPTVFLDLSGADLSGLPLEDCNLQEANLTGANLAGANLHNARLGGADLRGADLRGADAAGAGLHRAKLQDADLRGTGFAPIGIGRQLMCLSPATFQNARWDRDRLEEILAILNLNRDWEIRFEIVPRG